MQPSEALSTSAQVAATLAGFAGVVVAFRSGSIHEWSRIDKFRLRILLMNSGIPFVLCVIAMLFSSTTLNQDRIWQVCSVLTFVTTVLAGQSTSRGFRGVSSEDLRAAGSPLVFYSSSIVAIAVTLLQLYNAIVLKTFWPFFAAIATFLSLAMLQFIRLVLAGHASGPQRSPP
jgi:hypothetical protein